LIASTTTDFDKMRAASKVSLEDAAKITGLSVDQIRICESCVAGPLHPDDLLLCIGVAFGSLFVLELLKLPFRQALRG
jgi:hypothetical protein